MERVYTDLLALKDRIGLTGDLSKDLTTLLSDLGYQRTLGHSAQVAERSARLARQFGVNEQSAITAAWLHDISVIIPDTDRLAVAESWEMVTYAAEIVHPMLLHQRQSAFLARELFAVQDEEIVAAIACHTTLRAGASALDKVLFVADKLAWDQDGLPPYAAEMEAALAVSLQQAALVYICWLRSRRTTLRAVHPWLIEAYQELAADQW